MRGTSRSAVCRIGASAFTLAIMLSACGGAADPQGAADPGEPASPSQAAGDGPTIVELVIENNQVSPTLNRLPVDIGDAVRLTVTSDDDESIHVHGVEVWLVLEGGVEGVLEFDIPPGLPRGRYDVEGHESGVLLFELRVR